jgi:WS/DGAT/MGAT family acyltransferase
MSDSQRLSALDALFVGIETNEVHMHVGALLVFERGPLGNEDGGVDFEQIAEYLETALVKLPNYHRRLRRTPGLQHPVWVDDQHFDMRFHLRHSALPRPGDDRQLKRLAGRIFSQGLDRSRPLWEIWVVEGLERDRFALIAKVHHAMMDGMGGVTALAGLFRASPETSFKRPEHPWQAQPAPGGVELLRNEILYRSSGIRELVHRARLTWERHKRGDDQEAKDVTGGMLNILKSILPAPATSLNPRHIGPHRRFDVCRYDLKVLKNIKNVLGGKLNDVVLALCAGAFRRFLTRAGDDLASLHKFRVLMPIAARAQSEKGGNHMAISMLELPLHIRDPKQRYEQILRASARAKGESHQAEGSRLLEELSDVTADAFMRESVRFAGALRPYNVIITNMPGPPFPLYLLGAKLVEMFPLAPLFYQQGLGIALFSYCGTMSIGLAADRDAIPNLQSLVEDFDSALEELSSLAEHESHKSTSQTA